MSILALAGTDFNKVFQKDVAKIFWKKYILKVSFQG